MVPITSRVTRMAASATSVSRCPAAARAASTSHSSFVTCSGAAARETGACEAVALVQQLQGDGQALAGYQLRPPTSSRRGKALRMLSSEKAGAVALRTSRHSSWLPGELEGGELVGLWQWVERQAQRAAAAPRVQRQAGRQAARAAGLPVGVEEGAVALGAEQLHTGGQQPQGGS